MSSNANARIRKDDITDNAVGLNELDSATVYASQAEAEAGVETTKIMTAQRVNQAITALVPDASTTAKGSVEISTNAERIAGTTTGGSGAPLVTGNDAFASTSSGASDEGKAPLADSNGEIPVGFVPTIPASKTSGIVKFGGDGSDGVQADADLTITGSNDTYIVKNFSSWTAGSVARTCTITPTGCVTHIKISGDADFTNWTFSFDGKGGQGGAGGAGGSGAGNVPGQAGTDGGLGYQTTYLTVPDGGNGGGIVGGGGGGTGGSSISSDGSDGSTGTGSSPGSGGVASVVDGKVLSLNAIIPNRKIYAMVSPGGSGGGGGGKNTSGASGGAGGAGGSSGGTLIIEVSGSVTFSSTAASLDGSIGANGGNGSGSGSSAGGGGGGGGGAGGIFILLYGGTASGTLTPSVSGAAGGTGGTGDGGGNGGNGSAGKDGLYFIGKNTVFA